MNACGKIAFDTGSSALRWAVPGDAGPGDLMVLANLPMRIVTGFGWQRVDSIVDRTSAFVRSMVEGDAGVEWVFKVDGPPLGGEDQPVWLVLREVYVGRHFDERLIPVEVPLDR